MPFYRPSAQARIQLRLDDGGDRTGRPEGNAPPADPNVGSAEILRKEMLLETFRSILTDEEYSEKKAALDAEKKALLQSEGAERPGSTEVASDGQTLVFSALPISATITRNGLRDASVAEVVFDYRVLPIDPRSVRSAMVSLTIGSVGAEDYRAGIVDRVERGSDGMLASIVEQNSADLEFIGGKTRFVGFCDEWKIEHSDRASTIKLSMRDLSALMLDQKLPKGIGIDQKLPIEQGVSQLIDLFPTTKGMKVYFGTPEDVAAGSAVVGPVPDDSLHELAKISKKKTKSKAQKPGDHDDSVWDHIATTCAKLGLIAMVRGLSVFICEPRSVLGSTATPRKMVWGRNLSGLEFVRKMAGITTQTVEVRSPNPTIGRTMWARYPVYNGEPTSGILGDPNSPQPVASRAQSVAPSGEKQEQVEVFSIARVGDLATLEKIARNTFEEMARQEIEGSFETADLESWEGWLEFGDEDLLTMMPGDPIEFLYAPPEEADEDGSKRLLASVQQIETMASARRAHYLQGLGMSADAAQRLAEAAQFVQQANVFRVSTLEIQYDNEVGITVSGSFYNYISIKDPQQ